ncbi:hypothetical protein IEQ34_018720 [Dendrobium chrysotoxum]|uniref:Uncharacterized protein n=1 Tax=Dendrobium chrysotoxum TaxID=161865 RepID=A0AAV7G4V1_DENCH|nr:hypothetical protein IEQ34_018720 [Dendrobium chrysotoxum]
MLSPHRRKDGEEANSDFSTQRKIERRGLMSANSNLSVLLGLGIAGILIVARKLKRVVKEDFGAFVERFDLLPLPQPAPPKLLIPSLASPSRSQTLSSQEIRRQVPSADEEIWLIDNDGAPIKKRGQTICADIQSMLPGTRVHIEVNENMVSCNMPESILLGSYLGVVARDPILASISFSYWCNKGMESFKKRMLVEVEVNIIANSQILYEITFYYEKSIARTKIDHGHLRRPNKNE